MSARLRSALTRIPSPAGLAVSASLSVWTLTAVFAPAATAGREQGRRAGSAPAAAAAPTAGSTGGTGSTAASVPAAPQPVLHTPHRGHSTGSGAQPSTSDGSSHTAGSTSTRGAGASRSASSGSGTSGAPGAAAGAGEADAPAAAAAPAPAAASGSHGKGKGARTAEREAQVRARQEANVKRPRRGTAPPPQEAPAPAAPAPSLSAAAPLAPVAATSATPATAASTPLSGAGRSQSSGSAPARHAAASSRGAADRRRAGAAGASSAPAAVALLPAATDAAATTGAIHRYTGAARGRSRHQAAPTPLISTVTRIIDVVPALVRIVIAALAALALLLAASTRLATRRALRLARQREQLLKDVGLLQGALLPALPSRLGPVGTSAAYRPASGPGAGGDFYDVFALGDGQLAVIVGDVSGHGRDALPLTTLVRFTLRAYLEAGLSPRGALQAAAAVLERQLGGSFATVVAATYDPDARTLVYACAGHPHPIFAGAPAIAPITACSSPPIGVGEPTGLRQTVVALPGRSLICFHTDGLVEARMHGELFGAPRLARTLQELPPEASAATLLDRVAEQCDRRPDDMAACLLRLEGEERAAGVQVEELELEGAQSSAERAARFLAAGGLAPAELHDALNSVRSAVARHGRVVLALHRGSGRPEVVLRPQNVTLLSPRSATSARPVGVSI